MLDYRNLNVVHVTPQLAGGVASVIEQLAREQMRLGADVVVVHPSSRDLHFNTDGIDVEECPTASFRGGTMLFGVPYWKAPLVNLENRFTVIHYHGLAGQGCLGRNRFPSICTLHGVSALAELSPVRASLVRIGFRRQTEFIAVDSATAEYFSNYSPNRISVIPNGLPPLADLIVPGRDENHVITFVGNLDELKGYRFALDAARILDANGLKFKMIFAGPALKEELAFFEGFRNQNALQGCVEYLGVVKDAGTTLIPRSDIILLPSRTEGSPMSLLEALRAGKALLATRVGGIPELLKDGENGFFVERDGSDIADKASRLLSNPELLRAFSDKSKGFFEEGFRIENVCELYREAYSRAIDSFEGRSR